MSNSSTSNSSTSNSSTSNSSSNVPGRSSPAELRFGPDGGGYVVDHRGREADPRDVRFTADGEPHVVGRRPGLVRRVFTRLAARLDLRRTGPPE